MTPLRNQAKLTIWDALKFYAAPVPGMLFNEADLMVRYPSCNKLQLFGADMEPDWPMAQPGRGVPTGGVKRRF